MEMIQLEVTACQIPLSKAADPLLVAKMLLRSRRSRQGGETPLLWGSPSLSFGSAPEANRIWHAEYHYAQHIECMKQNKMLCIKNYSISKCISL